ncbi:hypothetical protein GGX14DRAFT_662841 [Mycena pura]|uniref:Uncharacterized protein n=1 Tax=Mycena pura TaxID=153505 RepID=A0AAD6VT98_9AGAR|nr:hypothetical protein GGX14DRAFT_662841 [Mycena pura]
MPRCRAQSLTHRLGEKTRIDFAAREMKQQTDGQANARAQSSRSWSLSVPSCHFRRSTFLPGAGSRAWPKFLVKCGLTHPSLKASRHSCTHPALAAFGSDLVHRQPFFAMPHRPADRQTSEGESAVLTNLELVCSDPPTPHRLASDPFLTGRRRHLTSSPEGLAIALVALRVAVTTPPDFDSGIDSGNGPRSLERAPPDARIPGYPYAQQHWAEPASALVVRCVASQFLSSQGQDAALST